jgi:hypothetical protein
VGQDRTGLNSMISPVQLISQPMTAVKTGIDQKTSQSTSRSHSADALTSLRHGCADPHDATRLR